MIQRNILAACLASLSLAFVAPQAEADLVITYDVNIVQSGSVTVGSTIDWEIFATVSEVNGGPTVGTNNGIAAAAIDLQDSTGEVLNPGMVQTGPGQDFEGYPFFNPGTYNGTTLQNIGVFQFDPDANTRGEPGDLGPHLLATGSYTVTNVGMHTLSTVMSASDSQYWSTPGPGATNTPYQQVLFGMDTINVVAAVPEPSSLAMMGIAVLGGIGLHRRRKTRRKNA